MPTKKKPDPASAKVNREERVTVRLTPAEAEEMSLAAGEMGVTISTWIRVAARAKLRAHRKSAA